MAKRQRVLTDGDVFVHMPAVDEHRDVALLTGLLGEPPLPVPTVHTPAIFVDGRVHTAATAFLATRAAKARATQQTTAESLAYWIRWLRSERGRISGDEATSDVFVATEEDLHDYRVFASERGQLDDEHDRRVVRRRPHHDRARLRPGPAAQDHRPGLHGRQVADHRRVRRQARVIYVEEELGQLFYKMMSQDKVEKMVTKAWDSGVLETLTKHESIRCANPHVSIIGHITPDELYERLEKRLVDNEFSNRWLYALIKPTQIVDLEPHPHELDGGLELAVEIVKKVREIADDPSAAEFTLDPAATELFRATSRFMYDHRPTGAMEKQIVRWRSQMFKLALIYAAIDGTRTITGEHYAAARSAWAYNARSARAFFGGMTGNSHADKFLAMWKAIECDELTLTDVSDMFSKNLAAVKRDAMLNQLQRDGILTVERGETGPNGGRRPHLVRYVGQHAGAQVAPADW